MLLKKMMLVLLVLPFFAVNIKCKSTEKEKSTNLKPLKEVQLDTTMISTFNADRTMELKVEKKLQKGDPAAHFHFIVYNTNNRNVIILHS